MGVSLTTVQLTLDLTGDSVTQSHLTLSMLVILTNLESHESFIRDKFQDKQGFIYTILKFN